MERTVIYSELGKLRATSESNYQARIRDERIIIKLDAFESPAQVIAYYIKYGWASSESDFIIRL